MPHQPSLARDQNESLHELGFVERRKNMIFFSRPGVGKTHVGNCGERPPE